MSLDFYRAKARESIDSNETFIGLDDELQEFLYKKRDALDYDVKCIYEIDPYDDTELDSGRIKAVMEVCSKLKGDGIFTDYDDAEEAQEVFAGLEILCKEALEHNQRIFAIGD